MNDIHEAIAAEAFARIHARIVRNGDIGEPRRYVEAEPFPATEPVQEPSPRVEPVPA